MMSSTPAKILGAEGGSLETGKSADIVLFDPNEQYTVSANEMKSKAKNTPFDGVKLTGRVKYTILNGKIVYKQ